MLRLASDEDVHDGIIRGLRRRVPDLDLVRVVDVGLDHTPDPDIRADGEVWVVAISTQLDQAPADVQVELP